MSRRFIFVLALTAIMLYFSIIMFMIGPLHSAGSVPWTGTYGRTPRVEWCQKLRYRVPPAQDAVALLSFPGSGNTWLRYLLQQATGILTGSIYMDMGLYSHGFPAESVSNGSVLVVKTHKYHPEPRWFKDAILLIRKPRDAILADFNRMYRGHLGTVPQSYFKRVLNRNTTVSNWELFVYYRLIWYEDLHKSYLKDFSGRLLLVFYEVLVRDTETTLKAILQFLNHTVSQGDINCAMVYKEGIYRRWKKPTDFDPFTPEMYSELDKTKNRVLAAVAAHRRKNNHTIVLD